MPHVIIEYAADALPKAHLPGLLDAVHGAVVDTGLFTPGNVKTRAIAMAGYRNGRDGGPFIHVQLRIRPGRADAQKRLVSDAVLAAARQAAPAARVITVEVADLDESAYAKHAR